MVLQSVSYLQGVFGALGADRGVITIICLLFCFIFPPRVRRRARICICISMGTELYMASATIAERGLERDIYGLAWWVDEDQRICTYFIFEKDEILHPTHYLALFLSICIFGDTSLSPFFHSLGTVLLGLFSEISVSIKWEAKGYLAGVIGWCCCLQNFPRWKGGKASATHPQTGGALYPLFSHLVEKCTG